MLLNTDEMFSYCLENPEHLIERLSDWFAARRWYGLKNLGTPKIHINDTFDFYYDAKMRCFGTLLQLSAGGRTENYHVPLVLTAMDEFLPGDRKNIVTVKCKDTTAYLYEAEFLGMFCHTVLELMDLNGILETKKHNYVYFKKVGKIETSLKKLEALEPVTEDTSNILTKAFFEGKGLARYLLKSYRMVEGDNPELEMLTALSESGYRHAPIFLGYYTYTDFDARNDIVLEIVQEYVGNSYSGIHLFLENLDCTIQNSLVGRKAREDRRFHSPILEKVGTLGEGIAEMHVALARGKNEEFREERITRGDIDAWSHRLNQNMGFCKQNLSSLVRQQSFRDRYCITHELIEDFLEKSGTAIDMTRDMEITEGLSKIRTHQDLHLGQLIFTPRGQFFVLDFEGEPLRRGKERKEKLPPLRDIATMLRSFGYVKNFAIANRMKRLGLEHHVEAASLLLYSESLFFEKCPQMSRADMETILDTANMWERNLAEVIVDRYVGKARSLDIEHLNRQTIDKILRFWTTEKAVYELRYELAHRRENITIPVEGILRLTK